MPSAILPAYATIPRPSNHSLSSCRALAGLDFFRPFPFSPFAAAGDLAPPSIIRMGGGPRTFPGGVSKWQWKRMQAKKAKQLLKARLCRERQLYEMRKRAELKAAISELERPWEVAKRAPVLFSASADEQVKVLADRFQRPSGFDMWSERDGPQIFRSPDDLPSARFLPKGAVHNVKPYSVVVAGKISDGGDDSGDGDEKMRYNDWIARGAGGIGKGRRVRRVITDSSSPENVLGDGDTVESRRSYSSDSELLLADSSGAFNLLSQEHGYRGSEKRLADSRIGGDEMVAEFGRDNRPNQVSYVAGSKMEGREIAGDFGARSSRSHDRSSHGLDSELMVTDSRMKGLKSGGFDRGGGRGHRGSRNGSKSSYQSYSMVPVGGSRTEGDGLVGDFDQRGIRGHNRVPHVSNSEIGVTGPRMNGQETASNFSRRGGGGRGERYRGSYRPHSGRTSDDSRTEGHMAGDFDRYGNHERRGLVFGSRTEEYGMAGSFRGPCGRGRNFGNRGPYEPYSTRSGVNGDVMAGGSRRGGGHRGSYGSDSELLPVGQETAGNFSRRGGGGRGERYRGSYRPHSGHTSDDSRNERHMAGDFDRYGNHERRGLVSGSRTEEYGMTGSFRGRSRTEDYSMAGSFRGRGGRGSNFGNRGPYEPYSTRSSVNGDVMAGGSRRGGGHRGSYGSDSELLPVGSRKTGEMTGSFRRSGGTRGYKNMGKVSLRPTTELRFNEGRY